MSDEWLDEAQSSYKRKQSHEMKFGYDAVSDTKRRKSPKRVVQAEDRHLRQSDRKSLISTSRDLRRNFVMARWIIQKHIDFVVEHNFLPDTGDESFNEELRSFFKMASKKGNFEVSGRFGLRQYMRMLESARLVDGDIMSLRVRGGMLQPIEGDRIRDPQDEVVYQNLTDGFVGGWVEGIDVDKFGKPKRYCIHRRMQSSFVEEKRVSARKVIPYGCFDRFDQVRGVAPLAPVINTMKDLYESFDYALARAKIEQLFALVITRTNEWGAGYGDDELDNTNDTQRELDFNEGPQILDLDEDEDAKFLYGSAPNSSSQDFWQAMTMLTLKCLNIPYSFYDEKHTNFNGSRTALIMYLRSVRGWREDVVAFLNDWLKWRLKVGMINGEINLPEWFEVDNEDNWKFVPIGLEYWNPQQEIAADEKAIELNLRSREEIRLERYGDSWERDVLPRIQREEELLEAAGLNEEPMEMPNGDQDTE